MSFLAKFGFVNDCASAEYLSIQLNINLASFGDPKIIATWASIQEVYNKIKTAEEQGKISEIEAMALRDSANNHINSLSLDEVFRDSLRKSIFHVLEGMTELQREVIFRDREYLGDIYKQMQGFVPEWVEALEQMIDSTGEKPH